VIDLGLVAGEASGDLLGAHFVTALDRSIQACAPPASPDRA
jgi:lipid A disaccharide synthetase